MSFAEDVKNELCQYEASSDADVAMKIEASCLLRMGGSIILGTKGAVGIRLATANNAVARRLLGILKKQYELPTNVLVRQGLNLRKKKYVYAICRTLCRGQTGSRGSCFMACERTNPS